MDLPSGSYWPDHQRAHQYHNGTESYGGVSINIDSDYMDVGTTSSPAPVRRDVATRVSGDFDGDGRDDAAAFYGYDAGNVALFVFRGQAGGGFADPVKVWSAPAGQWTFTNSKFVAGDFNGDGRADVAAFYGYADGTSRMLTFLSRSDGTFADPVKSSWVAGAGDWVFDHVQLTSGDFNGDGRDEVVALYGYATGGSALFTFASDVSGVFGAPVRSWNVGDNQWWGSSSQLVSGDFNGDGREEVAAFYGYADGRAALFTWANDGTGSFSGPSESWNVPANSWWGGDVQVTAGDFNGDGRTDVGAVYSYASGVVTAFTFLADGTGGFADPVSSWSVPAGQWYTDHAQFLAGDFDGTGRDEMGAFYGYADGRAAMFTFMTDTAGKFADPTSSWSVGMGQWYGDNVDMA
jgi:FG-GAP-like repeat